MSCFNDWEAHKIIHKSEIMEFEFLNDNSYIEEIDSGYYYLAVDIGTVEKKFYTKKNEEIADELNLGDVQKEIATFVKKLNRYNYAKDIAQTLMGRMAELKGTTIKNIHEDMGVPLNEDAAGES